MKTEQKQKHVEPALIEIGFQSYSAKEKRGILVSTLTSKSFSRFRVERSDDTTPVFYEAKFVQGTRNCQPITLPYYFLVTWARDCFIRSLAQVMYVVKRGWSAGLAPS
jgi:hypothetical protein